MRGVPLSVVPRDDERLLSEPEPDGRRELRGGRGGLVVPSIGGGSREERRDFGLSDGPWRWARVVRASQVPCLFEWNLRETISLFQGTLPQ